MSKIPEKVIEDQLFDFLQTSNLFEVFQGDFLKDQSTESALIQIRNDLSIASDEGLLSVVVLLVWCLTPSTIWS